MSTSKLAAAELRSANGRSEVKGLRANEGAADSLYCTAILACAARCPLPSFARKGMLEINCDAYLVLQSCRLCISVSSFANGIATGACA